MKKTALVIILCGFALSLWAQEIDDKKAILQAFENVRVQLAEFDKERLLDSLDQEKLPRLVSGGLFGGGNMSNFIITRDHHTMSSYMKWGAEVGGFIDFSLSKHFAIQPQVIITAQQNYFAATDTTNRLWSFGMEIPVYFLGRFGNLEKGYVQFGGGIFTHFTFASNTGKYENVDQASDIITPPGHNPKDDHDYSRLYTLHNNHFGLCVMVGYEFSFGMQINAQYKISLSDIAGFYSEMKGKEVADALIYPQSVSLHIGYRWR